MSSTQTPEHRSAAKNNQPTHTNAQMPNILPESEDSTGTFAGIYRQIAKPPAIRANVVVFALLLTTCLVVSGYADITLPYLNPAIEAYFDGQTVNTDTLPSTVVNVQLPFALFIGALLGPAIGGLSVFAMLITGIVVLPLFNQGTGFTYLPQPGFGYLLGLLFASITAGRLGLWTYKNPQPNKSKLFKSDNLIARWLFHPSLLKMALYSGILVLTVHGIGLLSLYIHGLISPEFIANSHFWANALTMDRIIYDLLFTTGLLLLVRPVRSLLWPVLYP